MRSSRSARPSRVSRPGSRFRHCSNGRARRSPRRSRPTCSRSRSRDARRSGRRSYSIRSHSVACRHTRGRRCAGPRPGTARSRSHGVWRRAAELDQRGVEGGDFWAVAAEQRLAPLLFAAARGEGRIEQVVGWAYGQGARELDEALEQARRRARERARALRRARGVRGGASVRGAGGQDPVVDRGERSRRCSAPTGSLASPARRAAARSLPTGCSTGPSTLYLIGDAKASKLLRPIFLALLSEVIDRAYELRQRTAAGGSSARCSSASTRPGTSRRSRTWPRSPRPRPATTSSSSRSSTTSRRRAAATASRPRRSSTATERGCCCRAWPTSRRFGTSPAWSARRSARADQDDRSRRARAARPGGAAGRSPPPRRCVSCPTARRCCSTADCRRRGSDCGGGSRTAGWRRSRVRRPAALATRPSR